MNAILEDERGPVLIKGDTWPWDLLYIEYTLRDMRAEWREIYKPRPKVYKIEVSAHHNGAF